MTRIPLPKRLGNTAERFVRDPHTVIVAASMGTVAERPAYWLKPATEYVPMRTEARERVLESHDEHVRKTLHEALSKRDV